MVAQIHLVDLAGSERLKESKSVNETANETVHINKSLLVLGQVISVLSTDAKKGVRGCGVGACRVSGERQEGQKEAL